MDNNKNITKINVCELYFFLNKLKNYEYELFDLIFKYTLSLKIRLIIIEQLQKKYNNLNYKINYKLKTYISPYFGAYNYSSSNYNEYNLRHLIEEQVKFKNKNHILAITSDKLNISLKEKIKVLKWIFDDKYDNTILYISIINKNEKITINKKPKLYYIYNHELNIN